MKEQSSSQLPKVRQVPPYTQLARVYEKMMAHVNYNQWAKYIYSIIQKFQWEEIRLLDIGCGTGRFLEELSRMPVQADGCDPSQEMLQVARGNIPGVRFFNDQLPDLKTVAENAYNVMTCLYDSMNYIWPERELMKSLATVYRKLKEPGLFIFDLVTDLNCREYFSDYSEREIIGDGLAYQRDCLYDRRHRLQRNYIKIFTADGVFEEVHVQKIYDIPVLIRKINFYTKFELFSVYDDFTFKPAHTSSTRVHFVLKK